MTRRLLNLLTALSLLPCVAAGAMWVRSYFVSDGVTWTTRDASIYGRKSARGRMEQCVICGYDLRAAPGGCPECGTASPPR